MILRIEDLRNVCSSLLEAVDSDGISDITETLEMVNVNEKLHLIITNMEYVVSCTIPTFTSEDLHATVKADVFLKLINKVNTETVEFSTEGSTLIITANGTYKLPMIYQNDDLLEIPNISINNVTSSFKVKVESLKSMLKYNSKILNNNTIGSPAQKMYYLDSEGCITFTNSACVNKFALGSNIKVLLKQKLVKLFKLFSCEYVDVEFGVDADSNGVDVQKIRFISPGATITSLLSSDDSLINPVCDASKEIRRRASDTYPYSISLNKNDFLGAINRLMLFTDSNSVLKPFGKFEFCSDYVQIYDMQENNVENIKYQNTLSINENENLVLDFTDIKNVLDCISDEFITFNFGNHEAVVIQRPGVYNVIPECVLN